MMDTIHIHINIPSLRGGPCMNIILRPGALLSPDHIEKCFLETEGPKNKISPDHNVRCSLTVWTEQQNLLNHLADANAGMDVAIFISLLCDLSPSLLAWSRALASKQKTDCMITVHKSEKAYVLRNVAHAN